MTTDLATLETAPAAFSAQSLTPSMTAILERAFEPGAAFSAADVALVEPVANSVATVAIADERTIRQSIGALAAALPSQDVGDDGNKLKLRTYMTMLAGCDERALAYACRRCLDELDWMPTIHQLKERIRSWISPEAVAISRARAVVRAGRAADGQLPAEIDPVDVERVNAFLRSRGMATRFAPDGSTYQEQLTEETGEPSDA